MRIRFSVILVALLFTSCTTTIIYSPKTIEVGGDVHDIELKGSDLKEVDIEPTSDGTLELDAPLVDFFQAFRENQQTLTAYLPPLSPGGRSACLLVKH